MAFYFAYGSNVNTLHLHDYLASCGVTSGDAQAHRRALAAGFELRTNYRSVVHRAGACNIEPIREGSVEGVVYRVSHAARAALRDKEGYPVRYRERYLTVRTAAGETLRVFSFDVHPSRRLAGDVPVTRSYRRIVLAGAADHGFSTAYQDLLRKRLGAEEEPPQPGD